MIQGFRNGESEQVWAGILSPRLPGNIQATALRKLRMLNGAKLLCDLAVPPNNRLEALKGSRSGQHSIRINHQWWICLVGRKADHVTSRSSITIEELPNPTPGEMLQ